MSMYIRNPIIKMADKEAGQDTAVHDDNRGQIEIENDRVSSCSPSEDGNVPISKLNVTISPEYVISA